MHVTRTPRVYWWNIISLRYWFSVAFLAAIQMSIWDLVLPHPVSTTGPLAWYVSLQAMLACMMVDARPICRYCGYRMRVGYRVCSHCCRDN